MSTHKTQYGTARISYDLTYTRRRSVGITVHPDQRVTIRAPHGLPLSEVEKVVRKKGNWIIKKQQEFAANPPTLSPRRFVRGEVHLYLGRRCRLQVIEDKDEGVQLSGAQLVLRVRDKDDLQRKEKLLENWYRQQAIIIFAQRLAAVYPRAAKIGIPFPQLKVRKMKSRWGSCSSKGTVLLNLKLIQTPQHLIDYVILHELAHLREHNHSKAYYRVLATLLPEWKDRREELKRFQTT